MNEASSPQNANRHPRSQFGTRAVFAMVGLAALVAWWARGEMLKEQRRDELIVAMGNQGNGVDVDVNVVSLQGRLGATLRRKPPTGKVAAARIVQVADVAVLREFMETFPDARLDLHLKTEQASADMLDFLSRFHSLNSLYLEGPVDSSDASLSRLAKIRVARPLNLEVDHVDDDLLRRIADLSLNLAGIREARPIDPLGQTSFWGDVTDDGLRSAAQLPELAAVFADRQGSDAGFAAFRNHAAMYHAELTGSRYTDASAEILATLPQLKVLTLVDTKMTDAGIAKILARGQMHTLVIENGELGKASIAALAKMTTLVRFELRNVPLLPELVAAIVKRPLGSLTVYGCNSDDVLNRSAIASPNAQADDLMRHYANDPEREWLERQHLWLRRADQPYLQFLNRTRSGAMGPAEAEYLVIGGPNINAAFLAKLPRIQANGMGLFGSSIDDEALMALQPTSSNFNLVGTRVTANGLRSLLITGKRTWVQISLPENEVPPVTQLEIDEIQLSTGGELLSFHLGLMDPAALEGWLPRPSPKPTAEAP